MNVLWEYKYIEWQEGTTIEAGTVGEFISDRIITDGVPWMKLDENTLELRLQLIKYCF